MKSVFITGGANGIGEATARRFRAEGWRVGIGDIDSPVRPLDQVEYHALDVRDHDGWTRVLGAFAGDSELDALVNNAGIVRYGGFEEIGLDQSEAIIAVNLMGVVNGCAVALPHLRRAQNPTIVNVASSGALAGGPRLAVYCAAKFGVRGLSEALDIELAPENIRVRCVMPWFTDTAMMHQPGEGRNSSLIEDTKGQGLHTPDRVATAIYDSLGSRRLHHPVGTQARLVALVARMAPGVLRQQAKRHEARLGLQS